MKEVYYLVGGVAIGAIAVGAYLYCKKNNPKISVVKKVENVNESVKLRDFNELLENQSYYDTLKASDLTPWFREHKNDILIPYKMVISYATKETLNGLGYEVSNNFDVENNLIQFFYDENNKKALKERLVSFGTIDSTLEANLIERDGMIVLTD